mmetsp:Transcript_80285/g.202011  ORF Transcript_80285/g.202011 Transcript_80285/m.202011 type:complete len:326 (+) Transcript_80285:186-1163(+)
MYAADPSTWYCTTMGTPGLKFSHRVRCVDSFSGCQALARSQPIWPSACCARKNSAPIRVCSKNTSPESCMEMMSWSTRSGWLASGFLGPATLTRNSYGTCKARAPSCVCAAKTRILCTPSCWILEGAAFAIKDANSTTRCLPETSEADTSTLIPSISKLIEFGATDSVKLISTFCCNQSSSARTESCLGWTVSTLRFMALTSFTRACASNGPIVRSCKLDTAWYSNAELRPSGWCTTLYTVPGSDTESKPSHRTRRVAFSRFRSMTTPQPPGTQLRRKPKTPSTTSPPSTSTHSMRCGSPVPFGPSPKHAKALSHHSSRTLSIRR